MNSIGLLRKEDIQLFMFSGRGSIKSNPIIYNSAYELWRRVWRQTFLEQDGNSQLFSDDFTRQSKLAAFFFEKKCIALIFFNEIDFSFQSYLHDSYFQAWPEDTIKKLTRYGNKILVGSNITVDRDFRGPILEGIPLKALALDIAIHVLKSSSYSAMTGTMRCDRGMNTAATDCGATLLKADVTFHNGPVDLMGFYQRNVKFSNKDISHPIWDSRLEVNNSLNYAA